MNVKSQVLDNQKQLSSSDWLKREIPRFFLLIATIMIAIVFGIIQPKFFSFNNMMSILCTSTIVGTIAISAAIAMIAGEMNFAVGAQATISAATVGYLMSIQGFPYFVAFLAGLAVSVFVGLIGSIFFLKIGVPSFIATLGLSTVVNGVIKLITNNKVMFSTNWTKSFTFLGQGYLGPIPILTIVFAIVGVVSWILIDKSTIGCHIAAVGANKVACKQVGIDVKRIKFIAFLISSLLAGLGGVLVSSQLNSVSPTIGNDQMMNAIAAAMLGATFLRPGRFNIQGVIIAAIMMTIIQNGIVSIAAANYVKDIVLGLILIIAVGFIALTRKEGLPGVSFG